MSSTTSFIYGLCVMFYSMMTWLFWRKGRETQSRLIMWLMLVQEVECLKDIAFCHYNDVERVWHLMTAMDMVIIPVYVVVLMELVKPGWFSMKKLLVHELPFVALPALFWLSGSRFWFDLLVVWGAVYGTLTLGLTFYFISQYHKQLKCRFSYQDNINLNWLRGILITFWGILVMWTVCSWKYDALADNFYMVSSLVLWMFVSYFVYRHENVMDELEMPDVAEDEKESASMLDNMQLIGETVERLFVEERVYLNPKLKLSDVTKLVGTNRTYLSRFFNKDSGQTFYDYVNGYRIKYAEELLVTTDEHLPVISKMSGFNSVSTFRRVFSAYHRCSPIEYRNLIKRGPK